MNPRSAQLVAAALTFLLVILVGATIFVVLNRPSSVVPPSAAPATPPRVAVGSPSPSASAFVTASPAQVSLEPTQTTAIEPTPTTAIEPTPTPSASAIVSPSAESPSAEPSAIATAPPPPAPPTDPPPTISPTSTPAATIVPTAPQRGLRVIDVGLDNRAVEGGVERFVTFTIDGPSLITARLSNVSAGTVRLCLFGEAPDDERQCVTVRNGGIERVVGNAGPSTWTVSMIGTQVNVSPFVTLDLGFNAKTGNAILRSFRYSGTLFNEYNGFLAELTAAVDGDLSIDAEFDDGQGGAYPYHLMVVRQSDGQALRDELGEPSGGVSTSVPLTADTYRVSLRDPEEQAADGLLAVFLEATLSWP